MKSENYITALAKHNRPAFNEARRDHQKRLRAMPVTMTRQDQSRIDAVESKLKPQQVWESRNYLAMVHSDEQKDGTFITRISIIRTELQNDGRWKDGITWDELLRIKSEIGFGDLWAVECFPPDADVVNVANVSHLWIVPAPNFGWTANKE